MTNNNYDLEDKDYILYDRITELEIMNYFEQNSL